MNLTKEQKEQLDARKQAWTVGDHNTGLMSLAWSYKKVGVPLHEAIADAQALYSGIEEPRKHDDHMKEVERSFNKVYDCEYEVRQPPTKVDKEASYKSEQLEWLGLQGSMDTELKKAVLEQNVSERRITTKAAVKSLFKNTSGRIRYGQTTNTIRWAESSDDFSDMTSNPLQCVYMTTTTFGDLIDEEKQKELSKKNDRLVAYSAKDDNVREKACVLLEYDDPMGEDKVDKDAFGYLTDEEKDAYRAKLLSQTCKVLERAGLRPTTVTFSGNRSYHCLFRFVKPVTKEEWRQYEERLKTIYMRIGADVATLSFNRMTRVPRGCPRAEAECGETQHIMYFDDGAEISLEEFTDRLEQVATEISEVKEKAGKITVAMEKTQDPKTGDNKWEFVPSKWQKSLKDMGIRPKYKMLDRQGNYELTISHDGGLYHVVSAQGALDHIIKMYSAQDYMAGVMLREKRASKLTSEKYEQYAGLAEPYHEPVDTRMRVVIPYRNGMLEITSKGMTFHSDDYMRLDIPDDSPTLTRDWRFTFDMSEFEDFLELACGRSDGDPDWTKRKDAMMSLLGYEICCAKESVNFFPVIVEKSLDDNNGGTGKSLITKSLSYMRKTCFLDFKTWDDDQRFFFADMAKTLPRVARCEDLPKSFDLEKMFNRLTEGFKADIKGKDSVTLSMETMPKFIATSNSYLKGTGNSYRRRYREFEITDWWRGKDPEKHYGHMLYFDWSEEEWQRFDAFMALCVCKYLREGLKEFRGVNSVEKSLDVNLGDMRDFFDETIEPLPYWTVATELIEKYEGWYKQVHAGKYQRVSYTAKTIKAKLKTYCGLKGLVFDDNDGNTWKHNGESKRWIQISAIRPANASHTGGIQTVTVTQNLENSSVTYAKDDPLFGDFVEKSEKVTEICVTGDAKSEKTSPAQVVENKAPRDRGDEGDVFSTLFTREDKTKNDRTELTCCVTDKSGDEKKGKFVIPERRIKTHRIDRDGNIILED